MAPGTLPAALLKVLATRRLAHTSFAPTLACQSTNSKRAVRTLSDLRPIALTCGIGKAILNAIAVFLLPFLAYLPNRGVYTMFLLTFATRSDRHVSMPRLDLGQLWQASSVLGYVAVFFYPWTFIRPLTGYRAVPFTKLNWLVQARYG